MVHHLHKGPGCLMVEATTMIITIYKIDMAEVRRVTQRAVIFIPVVMSTLAMVVASNGLVISFYK